ncbi:unnamed protein product [Urochloa humidicola]
MAQDRMRETGIETPTQRTKEGTEWEMQTSVTGVARRDTIKQTAQTPPPFCFRCKQLGHIAAKCPVSKGPTMHMYGFGFPSQGFYCLKLPGVGKKQEPENLGLISVEKGDATEAKIEEELRYMIDKNWQWKVRRIAERDYIAVFPNKQILTTLSKSNGVTMALYNIVTKISISNTEATASALLQTGWVQLLNVPDGARNVDAVTLVAELAGDVVAVDEVSIIKEGPVRVKMQAREVSKLRGYIQIFIEGIGYDIKFVPEAGQSSSGPTPPPKRTDDDQLDEDDDDLLDSEDENPKKRHSEKRRNREQEHNNSQSFSNKEQGYQASGSKQGNNAKNKQLAKVSEEGEKVESVEKPMVTDVLPLAIYDPVTDQRMILNQTEAGKFPTPPKNHRLVHTEGGGYRFLEVSKWPKLLTPEEIVAASPRNKTGEDMGLGLSQESVGVDEMDFPGGGDTEEQIGEDEGINIAELKEDIQETWEVAGLSNQKTTKRKFYPIVATRKSMRSSPSTSRLSFTGIQGTYEYPTNPFTILNDCDKDVLENIASDCDIILGGNEREISETLDAMKLEEVTRAALAEAHHRQNMEERLESFHALEDECLDLQPVDNSNRGVIDGIHDMNKEKGGAASQHLKEDMRGEMQSKRSKKLSKGEKKGDRLSRELKRISYQ